MKEKELQGVKEIARRANVAIATVDRVLHNRPGVSVKTRDKIRQIIAELNYQPNLLARRLASGKALRLAVLIPAVTVNTAFWEAPLRGIRRAEHELKAYNIQVVPYFFDLNSPVSFTRQAEQILAAAVDGLVMAPLFGEEAHALASACGPAGIPCVFVDANLPDAEKLAYIGPPLFESGYLAGKICTYGLPEASRVLLLNITASPQPYEPIERGFRAYITDRRPGYVIERVDIRPTDATVARSQLAEIFTANEPVQAVFVTNSRAFMVAQLLERKEVKAKPVLVGFDLISENKQYLSTGTIDFLIAHRPEEQGYRSVMTLYQALVLAAPVATETYMPIDIITRENLDFYRN